MPGDPIANITFKTYAYITQVQGLLFLSDLKLGQYMKVKLTWNYIGKENKQTFF